MMLFPMDSIITPKTVGSLVRKFIKHLSNYELGPRVKKEDVLRCFEGVFGKQEILVALNELTSGDK